MAPVSIAAGLAAMLIADVLLSFALWIWWMWSGPSPFLRNDPGSYAAPLELAASVAACIRTALALAPSHRLLVAVSGVLAAALATYSFTARGAKPGPVPSYFPRSGANL